MMTKFKIDKKVFEKLPNYCVGFVVVKGFNNSSFNDKVEQLLDKNVLDFYLNKKDANIRELVKPYRDAFYELNMNPNKFMCSIEALLKRVQKNGELPHINTIVDLGNALSVKYEIPLGAHDIDKLNGDLEIRFSTLSDTFLPLGETQQEIMPNDELVYSSGNIIKTRRWIWRQSDDGKITDKSCNIVFPIDGFIDINKNKVIELRDELTEILKSDLICTNIETGFLDNENNEFIIN